MPIGFVLACLLSLSSLSLSIKANDEIAISSAFDGAQPYLVVHESNNGASERAPGIYVAGSTGEWLPLIQGKVLRGGGVQGVLSQLSLTEHTQRYESLAIVDGQLHLFRAAEGDQVFETVQIGNTKNPIRDPVTSEPIDFISPKSLEEVSILSLIHI